MKGKEVLTGAEIQASWLAPPECMMLNNDEVHVWRASLEMTPSQVKTLEQMLSADELSRTGRFYFQKDRDHFIVARGLLRTILGKYLLMKPDELRFCYGPFGKPALEEKTHGKTLRFNASHSHGLALFSFALDREIGVDLEYIRSDFSVEDIAAQFFSQREAGALNALPENVRQKAFFTLWTRKEALMKADGTGLALDLHQYEVFTGQNELHIPRNLGNELQRVDIWSLRDLDAGSGYAEALAVEGQDWQLRCWQSESLAAS
jgi:4'-phosphopantetheinyl transferase